MVGAIKNFIGKVQNLPQNERLIIFIVIMALLGLAGVYWAFMSTVHSIQQFSTTFSGVSPPLVADVSGSRQTADDTTAKDTVLPTADWQTYTNTEYGFSIKYPNSF